MNRREARRIAKFRAGLIIESALANGWEPTPADGQPYSERDAALIVEEIGRLADRLVEGFAQ